MRIERLSLDFFGRFTARTLDFGAAGRASDFHIVYGPNEAGKTTTMEGYLRLLYGFPQRDPYAFQHQRRNLRVSGVLDVDGERRQFKRSPARSKTLSGADDEALPETAMASLLGGLSLDDYRNLLCLDDETIETGGEDIASAKGDVGKLLFSAAAGVADLNAVLEQAREEAGEIYRRQSGKTRIAGLKRDLSDVEAAIRAADVSAGAWRKLKDAHEAAKAEEASAQKARDELRADEARLAAMRRALPGFDEIERLRGDLAGYEDYPAELDVDPEELVALATGRARTEAELEGLRDAIAAKTRAREGLKPDAERLALSGRLEELDTLRSRMRTAAEDLGRRARALENAEEDMRRIARDLGAPADCDVARLVAPASDIAALEAARDAMRAAAADREKGAEEIADLDLRVAEAVQ